MSTEGSTIGTYNSEATAHSLITKAPEPQLASTRNNWLSSKALQWNAVMGGIALLLVVCGATGLLDLGWVLLPRNIEYLVVNLIFLGTIHVVFTVILLVAAPKFADRLQMVKKKFVWFLPLVASVAVASLFAFSTRYIFGASHQFIIFFGLIAPTFHSISQHKGLCLDWIKLPHQRSSVKKWWHFAIYFLIAANVAVYFLEAPIVKTALTILAFGIFSTLTIKSFLAMRNDSSLGWAAYLFCARIMIFPFMLIMPVAGLVIACLHGVEYVSVVLSIVKAEDVFKNSKHVALFGGLIGLVIVATYGATLESASHIPGLIADTFIATAVFTHYFFDGVLFRGPSFYLKN